MGVGTGVEIAAGPALVVLADSDPHAANNRIASTAIPRESRLVVVTRVIMVVVAVIVSCVIVPVMGVVVTGVWIERWSLCRWCRRRDVLIAAFVTMRLVDVTTGVSRVIAERDTFELVGRAGNCLSLAERDVVRRFAIEDEIGGLFARKRFMAAEPYDHWAVNHLNRTVFCGSFYVFVDFTGSCGPYAPSGRTGVIAGYNESPSGH